jgi:hypothetical protein
MSGAKVTPPFPHKEDPVPRLLFLAAASVLVCAACSSGAAHPAPTVTRTVTRTVTVTAAASPDEPVPSESSATALPDPCKLLPLADATTLAGTKLNAPTEDGAAGTQTACQYDGPTSGPEAQVDVFVGDGAKQQLHIDKDNLHHAFTSIPGIGEECQQEDNFVFVHKDGLWASINLVLLDDPKQNVTRLTAAARTLAANMP